ncbi:CCR4-Not complex 3'-5'-exoribonuclease subunit Ccr4-like isoform X2 [Ischnura elegans]|uniref:CCR4-Not complex 3'-5'-exoribonuclease subunit Ccr4-like isoform X2 n=1 Tax=Ischnura elegans TaxID=197161 RepID=UPI001ED868CE|nr:CCR4-Not complex 3'-5'-exoribonuclease subunit Ccr4-like isoform X2 [Ischnura elegans]
MRYQNANEVKMISNEETRADCDERIKDQTSKERKEEHYVRSLDLSRTNLSELSLPTLKEYKSLKHLYLEKNFLRQLPEELFHELPLLSWLDVRDNQLSDFPRSVANHEHLEVLLLQGNRLQSLPLELGKGGIRNPIHEIHQESHAYNHNIRRNTTGCTTHRQNSPTPIIKECVIMSESSSEAPSQQKKPISKSSKNKASSKSKHTLMRQNAIIQKRKNEEALKSWRDQMRNMKENSNNLKNCMPITEKLFPYGTDKRYMKMATREMLHDASLDSREKTHRSYSTSNSSTNIGNEISLIFKSLQNLKCSKETTACTPRTQQKAAREKLLKINELNSKIGNLKKKIFTRGP